jgi:heptosyltransferase-3
MVKDRVPLERLRRALVVKLGHHGDALLATPVLGTLKAHAPQLEVDALVYDDTAPMFEGNPALARLFKLGRAWRSDPPRSRLRNEWRLWRGLRERRYELLVHLSEHARGAWLARTLGAAYKVAPAALNRAAFWRRSFTHLYPVVRGGRRHQVELNLDALRRIGLQPEPALRKVLFVPGAAAEQRVSALVQAPFVHIHPASRWRFKCWPAESNAELIDRLAAEGNQIVITGAPDEVTFIAEIVHKLRVAKPLNLAGQLSLKELGALTARARLFIGVDSMPMHLAAAMGTPTLALFGPSGEHEWGPWNVERRIVTTTHSCRPCGFDGCGGGKVSECLTFLPVEPVHAAARELLALPQSVR